MTLLRGNDNDDGDDDDDRKPIWVERVGALPGDFGAHEVAALSDLGVEFPRVALLALKHSTRGMQGELHCPSKQGEGCHTMMASMVPDRNVRRMEGV
jgi:hypothetical protein